MTAERPGLGAGVSDQGWLGHELLVELRGLRADRAEYDAAITDLRERIAALEAIAAGRDT